MNLFPQMEDVGVTEVTFHSNLNYQSSRKRNDSE